MRTGGPKPPGADDSFVSRLRGEGGLPLRDPAADGQDRHGRPEQEQGRRGGDGGGPDLVQDEVGRDPRVRPRGPDVELDGYAGDLSQVAGPTKARVGDEDVE